MLFGLLKWASLLSILATLYKVYQRSDYSRVRLNKLLVEISKSKEYLNLSERVRSRPPCNSGDLVFLYAYTIRRDNIPKEVYFCSIKIAFRQLSI